MFAEKIKTTTLFNNLSPRHPGAILESIPKYDIAVYGRVRELTEFIKNISICDLKMNEGLTGLERHEGE